MDFRETVNRVYRAIDFLGNIDFVGTLLGVTPAKIVALMGALVTFLTQANWMAVLGVGVGVWFLLSALDALKKKRRSQSLNSIADRHPKKLKPDNKSRELFETLVGLVKAYGDPANNYAHELLNRIVTRLETGDVMWQTIAALLKKWPMEADRIERTKFHTAFFSDNSSPADRSQQQFEDLFVHFYRLYQEQRVWIYRASHLINFPLQGDHDYRRWRYSHREFIQKLKEIGPRFPRLWNQVSGVGWNENLEIEDE